MIYIVDMGLLTVVIIVSLFTSLIAAAVLFLVQLAVEGARLRREARASMARRLRYKKDHAECHPPAVAKGHYHTFHLHLTESKCAMPLSYSGRHL